MNSAVEGVEATIGYKFDDRFLLWEALQAAGSYVSLTGGAGNRKFPNGNKLAFDQLRQRVGSNINLNSVGIQARLDTFVQRAGGTTVVSPVTMTATVEAILGAVYLDSNMESVRAVMQALGLV
ncbi:MAG: hypothetical protein Q9200_003085 [Gallowayella weberi]